MWPELPPMAVQEGDVIQTESRDTALLVLYSILLIYNLIIKVYNYV